MRSRRLVLFCGILVASLAVRAGNRTLQTPLRFNAGNITGMTAVFAGDFTADGLQDVLVAEAGKIRVMPGTGNGLFGSTIVSECADFVPEGLAELNGDGRPDLYLIGEAGKVGVMFGATNGSFAAPAEIFSPVPAVQLVAGDFTGDLKTDLAVVSDVHDQIVVLAGNGAGGFPSSQASAIVLPWVVDAAAGDFDGDGKLDIGTTSDHGTMIAWNGGTTFTSESLPLAQGEQAGAADINGDGFADLVVSGEHLSVSFGKASRGLTAQNVPGGGLGTDLTIAKMDGDSRPDIVVGGRTITIVTHDGSAFRRARSFSNDDNVVYRIAAADFTGDGHKDVVAGNGSTVALIRGFGDGNLGSHRALDLVTSLGISSSLATSVIVGNVNGDADLDLIIYDNVENVEKVAVVLNHGDGTFDPPIWTNLPVTSHGYLYKTGDLNGDGRIDLLLWDRDPKTPPFTVVFYVLMSQVNGTFSAGPAQSYPNLDYLAAIADFTGDGTADVMVGQGLLLVGGGGTFAAPVSSGVEIAGSLSVANVNGDALPDIVMEYDVVWAYVNQGGGTFLRMQPESYVGGFDAVGDFNDDGFDDLIGTYVSLGDGQGGFTPTPFSIDALHGAAPVDVDGDGKLDMAGSSAIYFGAGDGTFDAASQTAYGTKETAPYFVSAADFDHNGSPDVWAFDYSGILAIIPTRVGDIGAVVLQVAVSTDPNPRRFPLWYWATATVSGGNVRPRGAVLLTHGSEPASALLCPDSDGEVTDPHPTFPVETTNTIVASFLGDEYYGPSSATCEHTTLRGQQLLHLITSRSIYPIGQAAFLRASFVYGLAPYIPTGTATFLNNGIAFKTVPIVDGETEGVSTGNTTTFPVGIHSVTVEYSGDANYEPTVSAPLKITVTKRIPTITMTMSATTVTTQDDVTFTATIGSYLGVTGTITFKCFGEPLGTVTITNQQAVLTTKLPWGYGTCTAYYAETPDFGAATSAITYATVYYGAIPVAPLIDAKKGYVSTEVALRISPISGATTYDLYRSIDGAPMTLRTTFYTLYLTSDEVPTGTKVAVYAVLARNNSGQTTPLGPKDLVSFVTFTDDPLLASTTKVKAVHITELQNAINAVRTAAGLTTTTFAAPTGTISEAHLTSLRVALTQARSALGLATPLTDPTITPEVTPVRALHFQELRQAMK